MQSLNCQIYTYLVPLLPKFFIFGPLTIKILHTQNLNYQIYTYLDSLLSKFYIFGPLIVKILHIHTLNYQGLTTYSELHELTKF